MKNFGIFAPVLGLRKDIPSILLKTAYTPKCKDVIWQDGEVHRIRKRLLEFEYQFPDKILNLEYYHQDSIDQSWFLIFTKRDIAYRDIVNNRFVFINKIYNAGTITISSTPTPGTGDLKEVIGSGTEFKTNLKPGDFLKIGAGGIHSGSTWYEIDSIESETILYLKTEAEECSNSAYVVRKTFSGNDFCYWSVITFHEKLLATNHGMDNIVIWTGSEQVSDLDCPHKTRFLYSYNERVLLVKTVEGNECPFRIRWSGLGDETDWDEVESDSGAMEVTEGRGVLQGCATYKGNLLILKNEGIIRAWNVEGEAVFNKNLLIDNVGTNAPNSIIEMEEGTYFYCPDNTFRYFDGLSAGIISGGISPVIENINPNFSQYIQATLVKELNQILWAIPSGSAEVNNKVLIYDLDFERNNWGIAEMEIAALGYYETEVAYDWSSLSIFDNWVDWWWPSWRYKAGLKNFPIDVCGSYDGKIYRLNAVEKDIGEDYTGYQVIETDLGGGKRLSIYDRLLSIQAYVRRRVSGTLDFSIKRDDEAEWQDMGSVSLEGENEILIKDLPVDIMAKKFSIKISGQNPFKFLGMFLKYEEVGYR